MKICKMNDCTKPVIARDLCTTHYKRFQRTGTPHRTFQYEKTCAVDGCRRTACAKDLCDTHYTRQLKYGDPTLRKVGVAKGQICQVTTCEQSVRSKGLCNNHYHSFLRYKYRGKLMTVDAYLAFQNNKVTP